MILQTGQCVDFYAMYDFTYKQYFATSQDLLM